MDEIEEKKLRFDSMQKALIIAYSNLYRDPDNLKFIYGTRKGVLERFHISSSTVARILEEWDLQIEKTFPDIEPLTYRSGHQTNIPDIVRENLLNLHQNTQGDLGYRALSKEYLNRFGSQIGPSTIRKYYFLLGIRQMKINSNFNADSNMVENETKFQFDSIQKALIIAYANLYREPDELNFIDGMGKAVAKRFHISITTLNRILEEWDRQIDKTYPVIEPLAYRTGRKRGISDLSVPVKTLNFNQQSIETPHHINDLNSSDHEEEIFYI